MKHTPAPWKVERNQATEDTHHHMIKAHATDDGRGVTICTCYPISDDGKVESESAANARLIAASPTMYEYIARKAKDGDKEAQELIKTLD